MEKKISRSEFLKMYASLKGAKIASVLYNSEVKVPKYEGLGMVTKLSRKSVIVNANYQNMVRNRQEREGLARDFQADKPRFGEFISPNKVIEYNGTAYLRMYINKNQVGVGTTEYFVNGVKATADEIATIKKHTDNGGSAKQAAAGVKADDEVKPIAPKLENIIAMTIDGVKYVLQGDDYSDAVAEIKG